MHEPFHPDRLLQKLFHLRETFTEIEGWTHDRRSSEVGGSGNDVATLLQTLLAHREVTLENLDTYACEGDPD